MELFLKRLGLDAGSLRLAYLLGRKQGRKFVRGALIFPGIRVVDLQRQAAKNGEEAEQLIDKRDAMLEAMLNFIEEFVNLDEE